MINGAELRFKFRAWDIYAKVFRYFTLRNASFPTKSGDGNWGYESLEEWEQFTGLKDKEDGHPLFKQ